MPVKSWLLFTIGFSFLINLLGKFSVLECILIGTFIVILMEVSYHIGRLSKKGDKE